MTARDLDARWRWVRFPLALFCVHRALLMTMAWFGLRVTPGLFIPPPAPFSEPEFFTAFSGLCRWDCGLYFHLARRGYVTYQDTQTFPLYPLLVRGFAAVTHLGTLYALIVVANLAGLGALLVIYRLFLRLSDRATARWGITALTAFPFAFFHAAGFAESLTVFFAASAILLALDRRYVAAGLVLALGTATRHVSLLAVASLVALAMQERGAGPRALLWHRGALAFVLPLLGIGAHSLFCSLRFHDPLAFFHARTAGAPNNYWQVRAWWSVAEAFREGRASTEPLLATYVFWSLIPWAGAIALCTRRAWRPLAPYALLLMTLYWSGALMGLGRFSASCWPAFLPVGWLLARRQDLAIPVLLALGMAQGFYFYLWSHWYSIW